MTGKREILKGFIVIEGIDGAGTSTQKNLLCQALHSSGRAFFDTCEPSPAPVGTLIRRVLRKEIAVPPWTLALLFAADREDHINGIEGIRSRCARGEICVSDRYFHSSLAYQGQNCPLDQVKTINAGFPAPECFVFIDVDIEEASRRRSKRGEEAELFDHDSFLARVRKTYHETIAQELSDNPGMKVLMLDGAETIEALHRKICEFAGIVPIQ